MIYFLPAKSRRGRAHIAKVQDIDQILDGQRQALCGLTASPERWRPALQPLPDRARVCRHCLQRHRRG